MTQPPGRTNNPRVLEDWKDKSQGAVLLGRSSLLFLSSRLLGSRCVLSPRARPLGLFLGAGSCLAARPPLEERNAKKGEAGGGGRERAIKSATSGWGRCVPEAGNADGDTESRAGLGVCSAWADARCQMPDGRCQRVPTDCPLYTPILGRLLDSSLSPATDGDTALSMRLAMEGATAVWPSPPGGQHSLGLSQSRAAPGACQAATGCAERSLYASAASNSGPARMLGRLSLKRSWPGLVPVLSPSARSLVWAFSGRLGPGVPTLSFPLPFLPAPADTTRTQEPPAVVSSPSFIFYPPFPSTLCFPPFFILSAFFLSAPADPPHSSDPVISGFFSLPYLSIPGLPAPRRHHG